MSLFENKEEIKNLQEKNSLLQEKSTLLSEKIVQLKLHVESNEHQNATIHNGTHYES